MLDIKKLLLPVDFSDRSEALAHHARLLVQPADGGSAGEVIALHVVPPAQWVGGMEMAGAALVNFIEQQKALMLEQLAKFCQQHLSGVAYRLKVVEGDPASQVLAISEEEDVDVVLIATHGYGRFRRLLLGSVAAKILHDATVPVLTTVHVEEPKGQQEELHHVLVAVDLGPQTARVITNANQVAKGFGAKLSVLHVLPAVPVGMQQYLDQAALQDMERNALVELQKLLEDAKIDAEMIIRQGDSTVEVPAVAQQLGADLLVLGRHGEASLVSLLWEHSYAIIRHSPCPVLSL